MQVNYEIDPDRNLVIVEMGGVADAQFMIGMAEHITTDPRFRRGMDVITDRSALHEPPSAKYIEDVVKWLGHWAEENVGLWAIVAPRGSSFSAARMTELRANLHGVKLAAFTSREEAMRWIEEERKRTG